MSVPGRLWIRQRHLTHANYECVVITRRHYWLSITRDGCSLSVMTLNEYSRPVIQSFINGRYGGMDDVSETTFKRRFVRFASRKNGVPFWDGLAKVSTHACNNRDDLTFPRIFLYVCLKLSSSHSTFTLSLNVLTSLIQSSYKLSQFFFHLTR